MADMKMDKLSDKRKNRCQEEIRKKVLEREEINRLNVALSMYRDRTVVHADESSKLTN